MTITVLAVAAGMIVPRMAGSTDRDRVRETAARFAHTARTVRELAVSRQSICAIDVDLPRGGYDVLMQSGTDGVTEMKSMRLAWLKGGRFLEPVRVESYRTPNGSSALGGVQRIEFHPDGSSSGASLTFAWENHRSKVVVLPISGRVVSGDPRTTVFPPEQVDLGD